MPFARFMRRLPTFGSKDSLKQFSPSLDASHSTNSIQTHTKNISDDSLSTISSVSFEPDAMRFVVGVDFGTTYSGFAVIPIIKGEKADEKLSFIHTTPVCPKNWPDQPPNVHGIKTPTVSCYHKSTLEFDSWGFTAAKRTSHDLYKIERVKLLLEVRTPDHLRPELPEGLTVDQVITDYLKELNELCLDLIMETYRAPNLTIDDVVYCFTVPVNWSPASHRKLRQCALSAGLIRHERSENLIFCFEPEAAAMSCIKDKDVDVQPGSNFLVVDCGGGTVDLFQCQLGPNKDLEELTIGDGGFLGGVNTDIAFLNHLRDLLTPEGFEAAITSPRCASGWANILAQWENRKRLFTGKESEIEEIFLPQNVLNEVAKVWDGDMPLGVADGVVKLTKQDMKNFFDPVVDQILRLTRNQVLHVNSTNSNPVTLETNGFSNHRGSLDSFSFSNRRSSQNSTTGSPSQSPAFLPTPDNSPIPSSKVHSRNFSSHSASSSSSQKSLDTLFIVGGFGTNAYLRQKIMNDPIIQNNVKRIQAIPNPEIAVLKGAVWAGYYDTMIRTRKARKSIGVQVLRPYREGVDEFNDVAFRNPWQSDDKSQWLVDTYVETFISRGSTVHLSSCYTKGNFTIPPGTTIADVNIYSSDSPSELLHIRNDTCQLLGTVCIHISPERANRSPKFAISIYYG
ncbi:hypothetical protein BKA69DRAFT_1078124, partial [Paraphysoderma sedebokerense]